MQTRCTHLNMEMGGKLPVKKGQSFGRPEVEPCMIHETVGLGDVWAHDVFMPRWMTADLRCFWV